MQPVEPHRLRSHNLLKLPASTTLMHLLWYFGKCLRPSCIPDSTCCKGALCHTCKSDDVCRQLSREFSLLRIPLPASSQRSLTSLRHTHTYQSCCLIQTPPDELSAASSTSISTIGCLAIRGATVARVVASCSRISSGRCCACGTTSYPVSLLNLWQLPLSYT